MHQSLDPIPCASSQELAHECVFVERKRAFACPNKKHTTHISSLLFSFLVPPLSATAFQTWVVWTFKRASPRLFQCSKHQRRVLVLPSALEKEQKLGMVRLGVFLQTVNGRPWSVSLGLYASWSVSCLILESRAEHLRLGFLTCDNQHNIKYYRAGQTWYIFIRSFLCDPRLLQEPPTNPKMFTLSYPLTSLSFSSLSISISLSILSSVSRWPHRDSARYSNPNASIASFSSILFVLQLFLSFLSLSITKICSI